MNEKLINFAALLIVTIILLGLAVLTVTWITIPDIGNNEYIVIEKYDGLLVIDYVQLFNCSFAIMKDLNTLNIKRAFVYDVVELMFPPGTTLRTVSYADLKLEKIIKN